MSIKVSEIFASYKVNRSLSLRTLAAMDVSVKRFIDVFGDVPVASINGRHLEEFRRVLLKVPARMTFKQQQLPILKAIALTEQLNPNTLLPETVDVQIELLMWVLESSGRKFD